MQQEPIRHFSSASLFARIPLWNDARVRGVFYQVAALGLVVGIAYYLVTTTMANLDTRHISSGFTFLQRNAAFEIGESLIPYTAASTYGHALLVGFLNTLKVGFIGIILTVLLGTVIGIARLSKNWLISKIAAGYIEIFQDLPILLQLFFWYALFYESLPAPRSALSPLAGVYLCKRGLILAVPEPHPAYLYMAVSFVMGCVGVYMLRRWARKRQERTGRYFPVFRVSLAILLGLPLLVWVAAGMPLKMDVPKLVGFNFRGGMAFSPEFVSLLLGLILYTSAFVAEVVRAGIQSVHKGQWEAAMSVGLRRSQTLNLVVLPQALRVIVPPLTSQMLNLTKNSSLAVGIGYPDFVSVATTTINQTGQSIEPILMIMVVYLFFSLTTSAFMNWYNKRIAIVER
jgi:general L-amino acid transport system permease protein